MSASAQNPSKPDFRGLLATWGTFSRSETTQGQFGFRLLPELTLDIRLGAQKLSSYTTPSGVTHNNNQTNTNTPALGSKSFQSPDSPSLSLTRIDLSDEQESQANDAVNNLFLFSPPASPDPPDPSDPSHLTAELSLNIWGTLTIQQAQENKFRSQVKPYRLSLKYSTRRFEARLGLQKISFGSASLIRPLMWFDRIDPRDPIQLTDGVYGLLVRTYLSTRVNLWAWLLYGNNDPKGWELLPTQKRRPEFGARAQVPAGPGELALTAHYRRVDFNLSMAGSNPAISLIPLKPSSPLAITFPETRLALDGKWDLGVGLWIEATLTNQHSPYLVFPWQRAFTLGLDYTFGLGNGLYLCGEFFQSETATAAFSGQIFSPFRARFLAGSASYPISLLDRLSAIIFYDTINHDLYSFLRWQRTYDRWSLNLMAFWNPKEFRIYAAPDQNNLFAGKGLQLMLLYNF